jgi:hypothetical protein
MDALNRLSIENECRKLVVLYCWHIDHLDPQAFADLYTEDARYKPSIEPAPIVGREAILRWAQAYPRDRLARHISTNQYVEVVDDDHAVGTSYAVVFRQDQPQEGAVSVQSAPRSVVEYVDQYRRTLDGWKFSDRVYRMLFLEDGAPVRPQPWPDFPATVGSLHT